MDNKMIIDILKLVPLIIDGVQEARELYKKAIKALEDGITPEEQKAASNELQEAIKRVLAKTA